MRMTENVNRILTQKVIYDTFIPSNGRNQYFKIHT